jgi:FixJ family two-component response regulator
MSEWANHGIIYVVDDDEGARESVSELISAMGMKCLSFNRGETLLEHFGHSAPGIGCCLVDVRMRGMSGVVLMQRLVKEFPCLPVILITAYADVQLVIEAKDIGAFTVLPKPYRDQELWDIVVRAMESSDQLTCRERERRIVQERLDSLSESEREVLECVVRGEPNKRVALLCDISPRTVDMRRKAIFDKFQVASVAELVWLLARINYQFSVSTAEA